MVGVVAHLLCSNMVKLDMDGFVSASFKPTVLSGRDVNIVVLIRNDFSPPDVSGQQSVDLRSWLSCVVPFVLWRGCL